MSPAQRKSAKARRSATRTARTTSARGKARGSALAKAMKVKGKTPAKRESHRKAARVNGSGAGCDMRREELELLLDREGGRGEVLSHVPACHPCTTSLTVIAAQRDAVRHLTAEPSGTAVEFLLERGARAGEKKLADLVYELAKACIAAVQDLDRRLDMRNRPRAAASIRDDVDELAARTQGQRQREIASRASMAGALGSDAYVSSRSCLDLLEQLEGASCRHELTRAVLLIYANDPTAAIDRLHALLQSQAAPEHRRMAFWNLMWALVREQKFDDVRKVGVKALAEFPEDWTTTYNLAVASAWLRDGTDFKRRAGSLMRMRHGSKLEADRRTALLTFEAPRFATALGVDIRSVGRLLGLHERDLAGVQHEAG